MNSVVAIARDWSIWISKLNSFLRPYPSLKRVLDLRHFGDQVRCFDQFPRCIAAGDHNVKRGLTFARSPDLVENFRHRQHVIAQYINQFVKDEHVVVTTAKFLYAEVP